MTIFHLLNNYMYIFVIWNNIIAYSLYLFDPYYNINICILIRRVHIYNIYLKKEKKKLYNSINQKRSESER